MTVRTRTSSSRRCGAFLRSSALVSLTACLACGGAERDGAVEPGAMEDPGAMGSDELPPAGEPSDEALSDAVEPAPEMRAASEAEGPVTGIALDETQNASPAGTGGNGAPTAETPAPESPQPETPAMENPAPVTEPSDLVETRGLDCDVPPLPGFAQLQNIQALPDPFTSLDGTRISTRAQWICRRAEISAQVQQYELGPKPARPSIVSGQLNANQLAITAGEPGNTVNFNVTINRPPGAPQGAIPALITIGGSSLDNSVFAERGIATIAFNNGAMGAQNGGGSRGTGTFYNLYGTNHGAGSMMAWAWGVSRIIDALENTPGANIDTSRLAVTGCSRNGKGALVAGAFDERIALTIPQESGAGGSASWRVSRVQNDAALQANPNATPNNGRVQLLVDAQGEQPWFRAAFNQFNNAETRLPFDHHMVMGLVAPRALLVIDNSTQIWLGNESSYTASVAASEIWTALGLSGTMGASQVGDHDHCAFPANQRAELIAFVEKFLLGNQNANTNVMRSDRITPDRQRWIPWSTPQLQ